MLFKRNIEPSCTYCRHGTDLGYDVIVCIKRGIMSSHGSCGAFRYEPTKRIPESIPSLKVAGFSPEDFSLEGFSLEDFSLVEFSLDDFSLEV